MVQSADLRQGNDLAVVGWLDGARLGGVFGEGQVRARAVIVAEVIAKTTTQVSLVEDDDVVEEFRRMVPITFTRGRNSLP